MPLSMTLERSKSPSVTPCFDGKELRVDSELVSAGLSAISVKGYDAGDPRGDAVIRHRNSFWSVHRPELSKLNWAANYTPQKIEKYLKVHAGSQHPLEELKETGTPPAECNQLTLIHATSDEHIDTDEDCLTISEPRTTQLSDHDLASHTTLHKSRAEFCVTIGSLGHYLSQSGPEPCSSKTIPEDIVEKGQTYENDIPSYLRLHSSHAKIETALPPEEMRTNRQTSRKSQKNENLIVLLEPRDEPRLDIRDGESASSSQKAVASVDAN